MHLRRNELSLVRSAAEQRPNQFRQTVGINYQVSLAVTVDRNFGRRLSVTIPAQASMCASSAGLVSVLAAEMTRYVSSIIR